MLTVVVKGSFKEAKKTIIEGNKEGEALEFRLDLFDDLSHISKLRSACSLPVIFTLRKASQGGSFKEAEEVREKTVLELLKLHPDYVDIEYDCDLKFIHRIRQDFPEIGVICSYHDFEKTPEDLKGILDEMNQIPAAIYKIATYANSSLDSLRMLTLVRDEREKGAQIAGMCMGEKGEITRILAPIFDSLIAYAPLKGEGETAPGQVRVDKLEKIYHFSLLNRETKIYALIGDPTAKSIGHFVHNHIFHMLKQNSVYVKIPVKPEEILSFFSLIKKLPFEGFSVTMPLKEETSSLLDAVSLKAKAVGAINTLVKIGGDWEGFNTDAGGALDAIENLATVNGKKVVILGAGGTAKALAYEALQRGGEVLIVNRTEEKAKRLADLLGCKATSMQEWKMASYDILMNTTSIGMASKLQTSPIADEAIQEGAIIFDAIFNPKETDLIKSAIKKGCQVVYGYEMFIRQGLKQLELWLNQPLDEEELLQKMSEIYHEKIDSV